MLLTFENKDQNIDWQKLATGIDGLKILQNQQEYR